jgi:hypothetical protein
MEHGGVGLLASHRLLQFLRSGEMGAEHHDVVEHLGPGDVLHGTLVATPLQACRATEVRVALVRREDVPRNDGNTKEVEEAAAILDGEVDLSLGAPREWPFELQLPAVVVPCLATKHSRVTWLLKGIGSRRLRRDYRVTQPLDVHSAPGV